MGVAKLTAGEASQKLGARLVGDSTFLIEGVSSPQSASAHSACFIEQESYLAHFHSSLASCWVMSHALYEKLETKSREKRTFLLTDRPYLAFVTLVNHFH